MLTSPQVYSLVCCKPFDFMVRVLRFVKMSSATLLCAGWLKGEGCEEPLESIFSMLAHDCTTQSLKAWLRSKQTTFAVRKSSGHLACCDGSFART